MRLAREARDRGALCEYVAGSGTPRAGDAAVIECRRTYEMGHLAERGKEMEGDRRFIRGENVVCL